MTILLVERSPLALDLATTATSWRWPGGDGRYGEGQDATDIKEFYLGMKDQGVRGRRRWKQRKTWR